MADVKISAGADPVTLVATDKVPVARSASTTAYAATMTEVAAFAATALPYSATVPVMDGTASAGAAAAASRGDHVHPTDTSRYAATNPSGYQTAAQVTAVVPVASSTTPLMDSTAAIGAGTTWARADHVHPVDTSRAAVAAIPGINYADNSGFAVNQRAYVSGTALAAGAFGHDRWKGGAGGGTYTFAAPAGPANTITITSGTLQQVVEGAALIGGNYRLSWTGTAQGRVGAGSYAASPVSVASIVAGANTTIEFNTGTLGQVKFEAGTVATPWQALGPQQDLAKCQRFFSLATATARGTATAANQYFTNSVGWSAMRATPIVTLSAAGSATNATASGLTSTTATGGYYQIFSVASGDSYILNSIYTLSADL